MKKYRRWTSLALCAVLTVSLAACGGGGSAGKDGEDGTKQVDPNCVYEAQQLMLDTGEDLSDLSLNTIRFVDDYIYASGYNYGDDDTGNNVLLKFSPDGADIEVGYVMNTGAEDIMATCIGSDGNFYLLRLTYSDDALGMNFESGDGATYTEGPAAVDEPGGQSAKDEGAEAASDADADSNAGGEDVIEDADGEFRASSDDAAADGEESEADGEEAAADDESDQNDAGPANADGFDNDQIEEFETNGEPSPADEAVGEEADEGVTSPMDEYEEDPDAVDAEEELTAEEVDVSEGGYEESGEAHYFISCLQPDGSELWRAPCVPGNNTDPSLYYANQINYCDEGLLLTDANGLQLYSKEDGSFIRTVGEGEDYITGTPYALRDGSVIQVMNIASGDEVDLLDLKTGELSGHYPIPNELSVTSVAAGVSRYPLYLISNSGIYGFTLDGDAPVKVLDFVDSDMDIMGVTGLTEIAEDQFAAIVVNNDGESGIQILTQVDPQIVANRKTLTLGCYYLDYEVRKQVFAFNKQNQEARISIIDYSQYDSDEGTEGLTRLNTDIVSGNAPDIMLLSNTMPVSSYISKGVFEDLTEYFESDENLSGTEYLNNVLDAFKTDGKMYTVVPSFYAITIVGKEDDIGDGSDFTVDMANELAKEKNVETANMFGIITRDSMLYQAMEMCGDRFIDWDKSACSFDSEEFVKLLEFIGQFPAEINENTMEDTSADYRKEKSLFYPSTMGTFDEYTYLKYGVFGTDITMAGFPAQTPGGAVISPQLEIAVNSSSEEKDACWSFVRRFLMEDYQETIEMYWPVSVSAVDQLAAKAMEPVYYTDEDGNEVEDFIVVNIGGEEIQLPRVTEEEAEEMKEFLGSLDRTAYFDNNVENIIAEESAAFFEGQKSAEEVADVIQSRVKIYINENS